MNTGSNIICVVVLLVCAALLTMAHNHHHDHHQRISDPKNPFAFGFAAHDHGHDHHSHDEPAVHDQYKHSWCGSHLVAENMKNNPDLVTLGHVNHAVQPKKKTTTTTDGVEPVGDATEIVWGSIRIHFETRHLVNDEEGRNCRKAGSMFKRGTPTATNILCSETVSDDCWGTCTDALVINDAKVKNFVEVIIPKMKEEFSKMLQVRRVDGALKMNRDSCGISGGAAVPEEHKTTGMVNTDTVIYVTARPALDDGAGPVAWATPCVRDAIYRRAYAGQANFDPYFFTTSEDTQFGVAMHEILHILGFGSAHWSNFVKANGDRIPDDEVTDTVTRTHNGASVSRKRLITPKVVAEMRAQFGCDKLTGMDLEEMGSASTAGSHVDPLVAINDIMIPSSSTWFNPSLRWIVSRLTLAALEDSGWYKSDYSYAKELTWGKNMGCDFVTDRCENWPSKRPGYFCKTNMEKECTHDLRGKGFCLVMNYASLPAYYKHLANANQGGLDMYMGYCPVVYRYPNMFCENEKAGNQDPHEFYGASSGCFESNLVQWYDLFSQRGKETRCLKYKCSEKDTVLSISYDSGTTWFDCPADQTEKEFTVGGFFQFTPRGSVKCPENGFNTLCSANQPTKPAGDDQGSIKLNGSTRTGAATWWLAIVALMGTLLAML